ncbi:ATP-binding protein [Micromonospora sp. WMMD1082]|uniref:ATP-binding protein n=1 Tax=Micromonospora sp. WMMD1082 TaxID=3016104 RepID=UPI002415EA23|nr:ATP-binding protein [Micromonospora sp. WMMD1082]MDG4795034.1 ATP-binding protein [Micromonospora sp. WMMD1082]
MTEAMHGIQLVMVAAAARTGADARLVAIRAVPATSGRSTTITGLPAESARTTLDRVHAAIVNSSGCDWPQQPVTLSVEPAALPTGDSGLDLAFAVALLAASGQIPNRRHAATLYLGELGLDGALRTTTGVTDRLAAAAHAGLPHAIFAPGNLTEAALATTSQVSAARTLTELVAGLRGEAPLVTPQAWPTAPPIADLADLPASHTLARRVLEVAAAGGHHLLMTGPPDQGTLMLAERLPGLLPDLDPATAAEVATAHRAAGTLPPHAPMRHRPPWQAPHHSISPAALTGSRRQPGVVGLAHGGVLFCADADQLPSPARYLLGSVLDERRVTVVSADATASYPARAQLLLATHRGAAPITGPGLPSPAHRRALHRMSALLDRIHIRAALPSMPEGGDPSGGESTAVVAARVAAARDAAAARWAGQPWVTNAEATPQELQHAVDGVPANRFAQLRRLLQLGAVSTRGGVHVLRLAFTIADLAGHRRPTADDVDEAIRLHTGQEA